MIQLTDISSTAVKCQFCLRGFLCPHRHHADKIPFLRIQCADRPGSLLILYVPSSLHGASAVLNPGGYMKGVLQPRQKRLPAGTCYIPSDLLHVRLPVSRVCLHPCHCVPSFRYAGERRETDPAVMKPHHNRRVCRPGAECLRIIYLIYLSFQNYITYKMTSVCHVFPASGPFLYDIITVRYASDLKSPLINSFASGPVR